MHKYQLAENYANLLFTNTAQELIVSGNILQLVIFQSNLLLNSRIK